MTRRARCWWKTICSIATVITAALEDRGLHRRTAATASPGATSCSPAERYDVMLTDVVLTDGDGIASLREVHRAYPEMPVIILSAQNTLDTAVRATDTGAFEYFPKPFDLDELVRAAARPRRARGGAAAEDDERRWRQDCRLIGRSQAMQDVYRMITRVLRNDLTVLDPRRDPAPARSSSPRRSTSSARARPGRSSRSTPRRSRAS